MDTQTTRGIMERVIRIRDRKGDPDEAVRDVKSWLELTKNGDPESQIGQYLLALTRVVVQAPFSSILWDFSWQELREGLGEFTVAAESFEALRQAASTTTLNKMAQESGEGSL